MMVTEQHGKHGSGLLWQPDADLDALNDQRYQSLDAKLSLALSRVITQAGDQARHVATKLRMRTQANARWGTFVLGTEILAMILNHFRTPGQNESMFTMEHVVRSNYPGDSQLDSFYDNTDGDSHQHATR